MDKIGSLLKQKRLEMGFTIEEISEKTRLTIKHIKAIEEGDISYFKDDLSYLRFFLKSYCDVLGMDFEDIKDELRNSIDDYTMSFTQEAVMQHEAIERGIKENSAKMQKHENSAKKKKQTKPKRAKQRRRVDVSLLSFLAIVIVVVIGLIFAVVMLIQNNKGDDESLIDNKPPVAEVPSNGGEDAPKEEEKPKEEVKEMVITAVSDTEYTIENLKEGDDIDIEITMGSNSGFRALVDGKQLSDPANQIYSYKTVLHVREKAVKDKKIQLAFGFMQNNTIKVNGKDVELPGSVTGKAGSVTIEFTVKGE